MEFGAHVSKGNYKNIADSLYEYVNSYPEVTTAQIFVVGPRSTKSINLTAKDIDDIKKLKLDLYIHSCYLTHLWSNKNHLRDLSVSIIKTELEIADLLDAKGLVVHINDKVTAEEIVNQLLKLDLHLHKTIIHLENMYHREYQHSFSNLDNLHYLFSLINANPLLKNKIKICLDTSHLWASGFPVDDSTKLYNYFQEIKQYQPIIHLNDNKNPQGSLKDNHMNIGWGAIWKNSKSYQIVLNSGYPLILEAPEAQIDLELLEKHLL